MILGVSDQTAIRPAVPSDRPAIEKILSYEEYAHRHMDWKLPLDWLGSEPYLVAQRLGRTAALIACPPEPPEVAWIRAFAATSLLPPDRAWELLWGEARQALLAKPGVERALTIAMDDWYAGLLERTGFRHAADIRMLSWENGLHRLPPPEHAAPVRPMAIADLPAVAAVDRAAFYPLWHHSLGTLQLALEQSAIATVSVADDGQQITGYSMSTASPFGGHLARLAVHPEHQGTGIGYALLYDLLVRFQDRGAMRVTVNTQANNHASLRLYRKARFHLTGESYPVYEYPLNESP